MSPETSCDNLDQRVKEGELDENFFDAVAHCLGDEVRRFARMRCGNIKGDVEDISQDAMVAAQRYLGTFRGDASLRTWLYRLVLSACSRHRRGRKNDPKLHQVLDDTGAPPPGLTSDDGSEPSPEVSLMMQERLEALQGAIGELREQDRTLLAEVEWQGKSLAEVAEAHDLTVSAVKSRMFRIRQQLKGKVMSLLEDEA